MQNLPKFLKVVHYGIILHFLINIAYSSIQLFIVLQPEGTSSPGPLFSAALTMDHDLMMIRRGYAVEHWVSFSGLAIYLAITEMYPRIKKANA